jgi:hypothetical protein
MMPESSGSELEDQGAEQRTSSPPRTVQRDNDEDGGRRTSFMQEDDAISEMTETGQSAKPVETAGQGSSKC